MMSEPGTTIEIEDVLSSIRRLVSQDSSLPRPSGVPHRTPKVVAVEADCLVLTPAQRVEDEAEVEPGPEPEVEAEAEADLPAADFVADDSLAAGPEAAEAAAPEPEAIEETAAAEAEVVAHVPPEAVEAAFTPDLAPLQDGAPDHPAEPAAEPTEAEKLLAEAEAALAESGAVLEDAQTALGDVGGLEAPAQPAAATLGDELTRLESTIAELEAAVAQSGVEFEPEEGHPFVADGLEPLRDLPEAFDAAHLGAEPEDDPLDAHIAAAVDPEPPAVDPDLQDDAWAGGGGAGMDWAEATLNLARRGAPRRLHLADAEDQPPQVEGLRSSYAEMRDEIEDAETYDALGEDDLAQPVFEEGVIDEAMLREMVAQMIREELRGTLGERITQNVRKLVRREIQRALMGQDFE